MVWRPSHERGDAHEGPPPLVGLAEDLGRLAMAPARSLWRKGPSSQPTPSHSSSPRISSSEPATTRAGSVSSMRSTKAPACSSA